MSKANAFSVLMDASKRSPPRSGGNAKKKQKLEPRGTLSDVHKDALRNHLTIPYEKFSSREEFEKFYQNSMAPFLLNQVELIAGGERFLIKEIEFYFTCDSHPDPFTHCQPIQEQCLVWYFHRTGKSYKSGTYKGLDIAIGRGSTAPGGILIRTIEHLSSGKVICGPCNSVDYILQTCGTKTINSLVEDQMKGDISVFGGESNQLYLYPLDTARDDPLIHTGRVGLYMTKKTVSVEVQADYVMRNYRSIAEPSKVSKGRHLMVLALCHAGNSVSDISQLTGIKENIVRRYKDAYETGLKNAQDLSVFAKRIGDGLACECFGAIIAHARANKSKNSGSKNEEMKESGNSSADDCEESLELSDVEDFETLEGLQVDVDLNCLLPWLRWEIQQKVKEEPGPKEIILHPFPHQFTTALFSDALKNTKAVNTSEKGMCYLTNKEIPQTQTIHSVAPEKLDKILGSKWYESETTKVNGLVEMTIFCSQEEGKLKLQFTTQ